MITFVVPAHNEERCLPGTLQALHFAGRGLDEEYEIIVVDDASSDRTAEVAVLGGARVIQVAHRQIAATRNSGARAASGDILMFVDADTIVPSEAVRAAVIELRAGAAGGGAQVEFDGPVPLYARILLPLILGVFRIAHLAAGCFIFCTRAAFEKTGGFDESLFASEEIAFSRALKRAGRFVLLRESVITSGRKLRSHSTSSVLKTMIHLLVRGPGVVRSREHLALWYRERREDRSEAS